MVARVVGLESMNRTPSLTQQDEGKGAGQVLLLYRHCDLKKQRLKKPSLGGIYFWQEKRLPDNEATSLPKRAKS
jgi:hypothetical protein